MGLDEEMVIRQALSVCKRYLRPDTPGGNLQGCRTMELREVKGCFMSSLGKGLYDALTPSEEAEMEQVLAYFEPILLKRTTLLRDKMLKGDTVRKINFASAAAVIRSSLNDVGLTAHITSQRYRAAVDVPLRGNTCVRFYVSYKNVRKPGYMDGIVAAILDMPEALSRLGQAHGSIGYRMIKRLLYAALAALLLVSCWNRSPKEEDADAVLAQMRADTSWIQELDSLAGIAIGPGAECIDPVWHLFSREGRRFFHNQDWGGVLEIPEGFIPEDDPWQAELSFHGTAAHSPDLLVRISFYAGFSVADEEEFRDWIVSSLAEDGFTVLAMERSEICFPDGTLSPVLEVSAGNADGVIWRSRHILSGPDGVEFSVCLQYPAGAEDKIRDILPMINRYPFSPDERFERGEAMT